MSEITKSTNTELIDKPPPKRVRGDPMEEENQSLRLQVEELTKRVFQLEQIISLLNVSAKETTNSHQNPILGDIIDPQNSIPVSNPLQDSQNDGKPPQTHPSLMTSKISSTVSQLPTPQTKAGKKIKSGRSVTYAEVVKGSEGPTAVTAPSSPPERSGPPNPGPNRPSVILEDWEEVKKKPKPMKDSKPKPAQSPNTLRASLQHASSKEETLKLLLRDPKPMEERCSEIVMITSKLPLTKKAQLQPMLAWKQALKSLTNQLPLTISLINPCKAELFYDSRQAPTVIAILREKNYLVEDPPELTDRDLGRRKLAYLDGYFLPLRRAALLGFNPEMQRKVLNLAQESLHKKFKDKPTLHQWKHQISKDLDWIDPPATEMPQDTTDMEV